MTRNYAPKLKEQQVVPAFKLPSNQQTTVALWDYKQKSNLVIFFFHSLGCAECRQVLTRLSAGYSRYEDLNTQILAISIVSVEGAKRLAAELKLPFPVLADDTGRVSEQYTHVDPATRTPVPAIFVVDRYGTLYFQAISPQESGLPTGEAIMDWLNLVELQCPECGISEWTVPGP